MSEEPPKYASPNMCVHYTLGGLRSGDTPCCEAGVNYQDLARTAPPEVCFVCNLPACPYTRGDREPPVGCAMAEWQHRWIQHLPCMERNWKSVSIAKCDKRKKPTEEEVLAFREYSLRNVPVTITAMQAVKAKFRKDRVRRSFIICPQCGKNLQYHIDPRNDHSQAVCDTAECLSWIE